MKQIRWDLKWDGCYLQAVIACLAAVLLLFAPARPGQCDPVTYGLARTVANNKLQQHLDLYGHWNGSTDPALADGQRIAHRGTSVAYNFKVVPGGHILVAADDAFSPVLLYSTKADFDTARLADPNSVESWIVPELYHNTLNIEKLRGDPSGGMRTASDNDPRAKISRAWRFLAREPADPSRLDNLSDVREELVRAATIGPLMTTTWSQGAPYNLQTPADSGCAHTLTGCVATAWAQLARYWKWPVQGSGSHSYQWNGEILSADFGATVYDWENMPSILTDSSSQAQKNAVSLLMYHMGVAAEMNYGCDGSGSSAWAEDILDLYFRYQSSMQHLRRRDYEEGDWLASFTAEFDADPARPVIMVIISAGGAGHEVVADGYQDDGTTLIHLNMGWNGYEDGFYNITSDFQSGGYTWVANYQSIVTGIEPDNAPPVVEAGQDQNVAEQTVVHLSGSAVDPEGVGISSLRWTQIGGPLVNLSDGNSSTPFFTAPDVTVDTDLTFQLRADDENRAHATDTVTITVLAGAVVTYTISTATQGSGSINLNPPGGTYEQGTTVTVTAVPEANNQFDHWEGDASGSANPLPLTVNSDILLTAVFTPAPAHYNVTITIQGSGSVNLNPPGGTYEQGTMVTVTAVPEANDQFDHWEGGASGSANPLPLTINGDILLTAVFIQQADGSTTFSTSAGYDINMHVSAGDQAVETSHAVVPDDLDFIFDPMDISISGFSAGSTITITIDLPLAVREDVGMYALQGGAWTDADTLGRYENGRTRIVIQLSDGDNWDQDQAADGALTLSFGLAIPAQDPSNNGSSDSGTGGGGGGGCFISSMN